MITRIIPSLLNSFPRLLVNSHISSTNKGFKIFKLTKCIIATSKLVIHKIPQKFAIPCTTNLHHRFLHSSPALRCSDEEEDRDAPAKKEVVDVLDGKRLVVRKRVPKYYTWDVGIKYIQSEAYRETYGTEPVWVKYKRNFKGQFAPAPRKSCIKKGVINSGSPCPICRDDYLVVDYRNTELLKQFISPHTGKMIAPKKTGLCQKAYDFLDIAIDQAKEAGLIIHDVPIRNYNYEDYYSSNSQSN